MAENFVNVNFRVACASGGEVNNLRMAACFELGIPTSFVVDRDGYIAFIGRPMDLDDVLPKVLDGSWRTSTEQ
ncbi:hypothetical protein RLEG12_00935 (plasmid) [Rhizobium leguminosarum bv. trifolii CB782]|nr:hypothetical protein RLEG12_00935 [Rhizobium leguminosarum bv. trifolii CB782]